MSDDLLTTVSKTLALDTGCLCGLPQCAECRAWSPLVENRAVLRALVERCQQAEARWAKLREKVHGFAAYAPDLKRSLTYQHVESLMRDIEEGR